MNFWTFLFIFTIILMVKSEEDCENLSKKCTSSNYEDYVNCMRTKRHTSCPNERLTCEDGNDCTNDYCDECDCQSCSSCEPYCESCCSNCCQYQSPCQDTQCCHKHCRSVCRSYSCRKTCRKSCNNAHGSNRGNGSGGGGGTGGSGGTANSENRGNITTVIHLNNLINNTNLINVPINLNNTNFHNISVANNGGSTAGEGSKEKQCCNVVGPRQCQPQQTFPFLKCVHYRTQHCGQICRAPIMHSYPHEVCDKIPNQQPHCYKQIMYIPQPQPRCAYSNVWPYVTCGFNQYNNCDGCYGGDPIGCSHFCFDDGFDNGQFYRKGPFYRPGYSPYPSCAQTGMCNYPTSGLDGNGFGMGTPGMGMVPPGFGMGTPGMGMVPPGFGMGTAGFGMRTPWLGMGMGGFGGYYPNIWETAYHIENISQFPNIDFNRHYYPVWSYNITNTTNNTQTDPARAEIIIQPEEATREEENQENEEENE